MTNSTDQLLASKEQLDDLNIWLAEHSYLTTSEVTEHLSLSRDQVDNLPYELLPWTDVSSPDSKRRAKRFHPTDVLAYHAIRWHYDRAEDEGRLDEWLARRREQLAERRRRMIAAALRTGLNDEADSDSSPDITPTGGEQAA